MSTTAPEPELRVESYQCDYCGGERTAAGSVGGSYCSHECYYRERGQRVLNQLESDHRICATCYGLVKTVEPIPDDVYEPGDGYQYPTEMTVHCIDGVDVDDSATELTYTRWGCDCGAVNPAELNADLQEIHLATAIDNCLHAVADLYQRGAIPYAPDRRAYFAALREHWRDARYALGRAVYPDP